jgi:prepilin-type processing-associated H-X9-DG protein
MNTISESRNGGSPEPAAFTLIELLAVIGVVLCLAALLTPALAGTRHGSKAFQCMANQRQLMRAMLLYAQDNSDFFPPNPDDGNTVPGHDWCAGQAGIGGAHEFDSDILADPRRSLLAPYLRGHVQVFHCPSDTRVGRYDGADPAKQGLIVPAARTISMSGAVGTVCRTFSFSSAGHSGPPTYPVNGPWLDGNHANMHNRPWRTYGKTSGIIDPSPARLFVLLDENVLGLNDASFAVSMAMPKWVDFPGIAHNFGAVFAFADGHAELHKWTDPRTRINSLAGQVFAPGSPDWLWLSQRTSARAQ